MYTQTCQVFSVAGSVVEGSKPLIRVFEVMVVANNTYIIL